MQKNKQAQAAHHSRNSSLPNGPQQSYLPSNYRYNKNQPTIYDSRVSSRVSSGESRRKQSYKSMESNESLSMRDSEVNKSRRGSVKENNYVSDSRKQSCHKNKQHLPKTNFNNLSLFGKIYDLPDFSKIKEKINSRKERNNSFHVHYDKENNNNNNLSRGSYFMPVDSQPEKQAAEKSAQYFKRQVRNKKSLYMEHVDKVISKVNNSLHNYSYQQPYSIQG